MIKILRKKRAMLLLGGTLVVLALLLAACAGTEGAQGPAGPAGPEGPAGEGGLTEEQAASLEAAAGLAEFLPVPFLEAQSRGCPACHALVDEETGGYTLPYEAHERAEARGEEHPMVAPDGTSLDPLGDDPAGVRVTTCLGCHAAGTGARAGMGLGAPLSLRDIVHPAHMSSQIFKLELGGSCFACHNVNYEGEWELLTEAVDVNEKGVPNPDSLPIPGAMAID